jgi:hypothetical protein
MVVNELGRQAMAPGSSALAGGGAPLLDLVGEGGDLQQGSWSLRPAPGERSSRLTPGHPEELRR